MGLTYVCIACQQRQALLGSSRAWPSELAARGDEIRSIRAIKPDMHICHAVYINKLAAARCLHAQSQ